MKPKGRDSMVEDDSKKDLRVPHRLQQSRGTLEPEEQPKEDDKGRLRISPQDAWTVLNVTTDSFLLIDTTGTILAINQAGANRPKRKRSACRDSFSIPRRWKP